VPALLNVLPVVIVLLTGSAAALDDVDTCLAPAAGSTMLCVLAWRVDAERPSPKRLPMPLRGGCFERVLAAATPALEDDDDAVDGFDEMVDVDEPAPVDDDADDVRVEMDADDPWRAPIRVVGSRLGDPARAMCAVSSSAGWCCCCRGGGIVGLRGIVVVEEEEGAAADLVRSDRVREIVVDDEDIVPFVCE
jgi:hypothetical protein